MQNRKAIIGTAAMAGANALRLVLQFLVFPIVAKLLGPEAYGTVALAAPFIFFLVLFGDLGLAPALVRAENVTREFASTVFWSSIAMGAALALLVAMAAYPLGYLLGQPEISPILLGFCPLFLLMTAAVVPSAILQRSRKFKSAAAIDVVTGFAGIGAALFGAASGWGAWSLVAQQIVFWVCRLGLMLAVSGFRPLPVFQYPLIKPSIGFGAGVVGSSVIAFFTANLHNVFIGTFLGTAPLGFYAISFQIVSMPAQVLGAIHYSLFPAISAAHGSGKNTADVYLNAAQAVLLIGAPVMVGLALTADQLVALLLGDKWASVATLIRLLAPFGFLQALSVVNTSLLLGIGQSGLEFRMASLRAAFVAAGIVTGLHWGAEGVAACVSIGYTAATLLYMRAALRAGGIPARSLLRLAGAPVAACAALVLGVSAFRAATLDQLMLLPSLSISITIGVIIYCSVIGMAFPSLIGAVVLRIKGPAAKPLA
jgi:O-antigen/teichoic acid export membrane protein